MNSKYLIIGGIVLFLILKNRNDTNLFRNWFDIGDMKFNRRPFHQINAQMDSIKPRPTSLSNENFASKNLH